MKKKHMNRLISLLIVPCLLTGPASPLAQLQWFGTGQLAQSLSGSTLEEPPAPETEIGELTPEETPEIVPDTLAVQRDAEGWVSSVTYSIQMPGDIGEVLSVEVMEATAEEAQILLAGDDGTYSATITANGTYTVTVTPVEGEPVSVQFTENMVDAEPPELALTDIPTSGWYQAAEYSFIATDTLSMVKEVTVLTSSGTAIPLTAGVDGLYSFTATANGNYTATVMDNAGNETSITFEVACIDTDIPVIEQLVRTEKGWAQSATYQFVVTENGSGIATVVVRSSDGQENTLLPDEADIYSFIAIQNTAYSITVTDTAGNTAQATVVDSFIDTTAPVISAALRETIGWATEATYSFAVEDGGSGLSLVQILTPSGERIDLTISADGKYRYTVKENGQYTITAKDAVGNLAEMSFTAEQVDGTAPQITQSVRVESGWQTEATYQFTVQDTASGIANVTVTPDGGNAQTLLPDQNGLYQVKLQSNGTYTVTITDAAGNVTTNTFTEAQIDRSAPSFADLRREADGWTTGTFCTFTVSDVGSGVARVFVTVGNEETELRPSGDGSYRFQVHANGSYVLTVVDGVGNQTSITHTETNIDLDAPVISDVKRQTEGWAQEAVYAFTVVDNGANIANVTIQKPNGEVVTVTPDQTGVYSFTAYGNQEYVICATDKVGNTSTQSFTATQIDKVKPQISNLNRQTNGWAQEAIYSFTVSDDLSGIAEVIVQNVSGTEISTTVTDGSYLFTVQENGTFKILVADAAGNQQIVTVEEVQIDRTPAETVTFNLVTSSGSGFLREVNSKPLYVDLITFKAVAFDSASGVARYDYRVTGATGFDTGWITVNAGSEGITKSFTGAEDVYTVHLRVYDVAGNCTKEYVTEPCILENTHTADHQRSPMPDVAINAQDDIYDGTWTKDTLTIIVSGSSSISGIEYYEYRVDFADPAIADQAWQRIPVVDGIAQLTVAENTNAVYYFRAVSYAGNASLVNNAEIRVQKSAPSSATLVPDTATGNAGWYTVLPEYTVTLPVQGQYFAPVQYVITYTHNGQAQREVIYDGTNAPKITADGLWSFRITAIDAAGNTASEIYSSAEFAVDTKAPSKLDVTMNGNSILNVADGDKTWANVNILDRVQHSDFTIFKSSGVTVNANADGSDSGMAALYYQVVPEAELYDQSGKWTLLSADGVKLTADSKNHIYFKAVDGAGNTTYFSGESILVDANLPEAEISFSDVNCSVHGYYNGNVTVDVHVAEPAIGADRVFAGLKEIRYHVYSAGIATQEGQLWPGTGATEKEQGRVLTWDGSFVIDGSLNNSNHVVVEIIVSDMAGNTLTYTTGDGDLRIDMTAPEIHGSYDRNDPVVLFQDKNCFTGDRTLTITVHELNFIPQESFVHVLETDTQQELVYTWTTEGGIHTAVIPVSADGHYTVTASITDAAGNVTTQILFEEGTAGTEAFVIDNTPSDIRVSYDNQDVRNELYFDAARKLTVTVTERNFDPAQIFAKIYFTIENGTEQVTELTQWHSEGNIHTATINCAVDGIYRVEVTGADALSNPAHDTEYSGKAPTRWTLDTYIDEPTMEYVLDGKAYNGELAPQITVLDTNLNTITMKLIRTRLNEIDVDVTDLLLTDEKVIYQDVTGGKTVALDIFPLEKDMDGRYTLTVTAEDKAGNVATSTVMFYANRYGSVYTYNDYLTSLLNGYFTKIDQDIVITEYNPSGVLADSSVVRITVDGMPVIAPIYEVTGASDGVAGESGWFEYTYTIAAENFAQDGVYGVVVSSKDTAGNVPENTASDMAISFAVDTTAPTLPVITGLENSIVKADSVFVMLTAMDNVMLDSVTVYLNGEVLESWTQLDSYSGDWTFQIPAGLEQSVRIVVIDKTGNTLDTDTEGFAPGYGFNRTITVSTNFFLRLYANRPLFIGAVIGTSVLLIGTVTLIILLSKKRRHK